MNDQNSKDTSETPEKTLGRWLEKDLSSEVRSERLKPAFRVDRYVDQLVDIVEGGRHPILSGESGVGKTSIFYEFLRRLHREDRVLSLLGSRIYQLSIRRGASSFRQPEDVGPAFQDLIDVLAKSDPPICAYFSDFHLVYQFDLDSMIQSAAFRMSTPILGEGDKNVLDSLFDYSPELEQTFTRVTVYEPDLSEVKNILDDWTAYQLDHRGIEFKSEAIEHALHLSHRFLARGCMPRKAIDLLEQIASVGRQRPVERKDVIQRFCTNHRVPEDLVDPDKPLKVDELERDLHRRILGQDEAVDAIVNMISVIKAGLTDPRRPFGIFLFVGPTGVGKTHLARLLAETLFGTESSMIRFNLADYAEDFSVFRLFGNPTANSLRAMRGELTVRLSGHPFAVILLDEFEKAHSKIHDGFLQLFDEGRFMNGAGESVSCRSTIIIATSNAGAEAYRRSLFGFASSMDASDRDREVEKSLFQQFRFEFLNRFDHVVHFRPLERRDIRTIALRELEELKGRVGLKTSGIELDLDESVLDWLSVNGYDPKFGARFLRRTIERNLTSQIALILVRDRPEKGRRMSLTVRGNRILARMIELPQVSIKRETTRLPLGTRERVRALDEKALLAESLAIAEGAGELLNQLQAKRDRRSDLLSRMNDAGFWTDSVARGDVLERFRELDVTIRTETRLARPILELRETQKHGALTPDSIRTLARCVEAAAESLREWQERLAEEGSGPLWMVLSNEDPLRPAGPWLKDLVRMEQAWCKQLHLSSEIIAYEEYDFNLARVALEVEGPGAISYLAMEHGIHKLQRRAATPLRIRIEVFPKSMSPGVEGESIAPVTVAKSLIGRDPAYRSKLALKSLGIEVDWLSHDSAALRAFVYDLKHFWQESERESETARTYGEDGSGARDPRTNAVVSRYRDAIRGRLDPLLQEWRRRTRTPS